MKRLLIIVGVFLMAVASYYFLNFAYYFFKSFEITSYGYGVLTGNLILFIAGGTCLYIGFKLKRRSLQNNKGI